MQDKNTNLAFDLSTPVLSRKDYCKFRRFTIESLIINRRVTASGCRYSLHYDRWRTDSVGCKGRILLIAMDPLVTK